MSEQLKKEVNTSTLLKTYTTLINLYYKHKKWYMWVLLGAFILGFPFAIINNVPFIIPLIIVICWVPGLLYFLITAPIHFLVGLQLRKWAKEYNLEYNEDYLKFIFENQKK